MASVTIRHVVKSFGTVSGIKGVDVAIDDGEFVVLVCPSGCGKSTLLRMIAGPEDVTADARAEGIAVDGPFPSDTVFLRGRSGAFDAVLTMYHDQGQIAMKLMGFERGVTFLGGFGFPICTPAHGTAYEIAGEGIADPNASIQAVLFAARMAARRDLAGAEART